MSKRKEGLEQIRDLPDSELAQAYERVRDELFRLKLGHYTNQVDNPLAIRHKRRELAQILTVQRARLLQLETQTEAGKAKDGQA